MLKWIIGQWLVVQQTTKHSAYNGHVEGLNWNWVKKQPMTKEWKIIAQHHFKHHKMDSNLDYLILLFWLWNQNIEKLGVSWEFCQVLYRLGSSSST